MANKWAYYNEIDPHAAAWIRELIKGGHIADGVVDERSIVEVDANDVRGFLQCHWFAGIAGWSRALRLAGICDDTPVWTGSPPCQPFSSAGKGDGFDDPRHLWPVFFRLIEECRPPIIFGEQVSSSAVVGRANKAVQAMRGGAALVGLQGAQQRRLDGYLQAVREHSGQGSKAMGVGCQASPLEGTAGDSSRILFDERCQETSEGKGSRVRSGLEGHPGAHRSRGLRGDGDSVRSVDAEGMERPLAGSARSEGRVHAGEHQGGLVRAEHNGQLLGRRSDLAHRGCDPEETLIERVERLLQEDRGQFAAEPGRTWIDVVRDDLDRAGYAIGVCVLPACSVGSPHIRQRLYWVADSNQVGRGLLPSAGQPGKKRDAEPRGGVCGVADADEFAGKQGCAIDGGRDHGGDAQERPGSGRGVALGWSGPTAGIRRDADWLHCRDGKWRPVKPGLVPLVDGLPRGVVPSSRVGLAVDVDKTAEARAMRLRGYGNAIDPELAAMFLRAVS